MKKFNKAYGEAKVSVREKISKRESLTDLPDYKIKIKSIDEIRNTLKETTSRISRQSKAHQVLINDNTSLADCFTEYGTILIQEEAHTTSSAATLGVGLTILGEMHNQFEMARSKLDIGINDTLFNKWQDFLKNDLRDATTTKTRYDKYRVTFEASTEAYKNMRKKNNVTNEKLVESEQDLQTATQQFSDVAVESLFIFEDIIDKITIESVDSVYDYIKVYENYFSKGLEIVREILPNVERQRQNCAKLRQTTIEKKKKRQQAADAAMPITPSVFANSNSLYSPESSTSPSTTPPSTPPNNNINNTKIFGLKLESLQSRDGEIVPSIIVKAIKYLDNHLGVEGLFRVSPNQKHLNELKSMINTRAVTNFDHVDDPHLVCAFIKSFLRELPIPLLTYDLFKPLVEPVVTSISEDNPDHQAITSQLSSILTRLPPCNKLLFQLLLRMLSNIANNSKENKMTSSNLAVVLAPNILYPLNLDMESITEANATIEYMIRNYNLLLPNNDQEISTLLPSQPNGNTSASSSASSASPASPTPTPSKPAPSRLNRQSVILPQPPTQQQQDFRKSMVIPPSLPAKPSLVKSSLSSSTSQLPNTTSNNPPMSPPALPPKRLSTSTSQLPPAPNSAPSSLSSSSNSIVEPDQSISKSSFNNRRSMFLGGTPVLPTTPPALPAKPKPNLILSPSSQQQSSNINHQQQIPHQLPPLIPSLSSSNSAILDSRPHSPPPLASISSSGPPVLPSKPSSSSFIRKQRPQAIKIPQGAVLTSNDGTTAKYSLLDDSISFSSSIDQPLTEDDDLIEW